MRLKMSVFLTILMLLSIFYAKTALSQSTEGSGNDLYCIDLPDIQAVARCFADRDLLRELVKAKDQQIQNLQKENDILKRELELQAKISEVDQREIASTRRALNDMKEVTDRSLKLAEIGKPKSNWTLYGLLGVAAVLVGVLIAM